MGSCSGVLSFKSEPRKYPSAPVTVGVTERPPLRPDSNNPRTAYRPIPEPSAVGPGVGRTSHDSFLQVYLESSRPSPVVCGRVHVSSTSHPTIPSSSSSSRRLGLSQVSTGTSFTGASTRLLQRFGPPRLSGVYDPMCVPSPLRSLFVTEDSWSPYQNLGPMTPPLLRPVSRIPCTVRTSPTAVVTSRTRRDTRSVRHFTTPASPCFSRVSGRGEPCLQRRGSRRTLHPIGTGRDVGYENTCPVHGHTMTHTGVSRSDTYLLTVLDLRVLRFVHASSDGEVFLLL